MTSKVHKFSRWRTWWTIYLFGDDFEAILGILEEDEAMEEEFTAVASDVSKKKLLSLACILAALKYSLRRNKLYARA